MAAPNVSLTVQDGGLGLVPTSADGIHVKVGASSSGTSGTLYRFTPQALTGSLVSTLGQGHLVDATGLALSTTVNGKGPSAVYAMPITPSTAATSGSVTVTRTSTSTGTVATTGSSPRNTYSVVFTVVQTGTLGAGTFKYSLDGGNTQSAEIQIPSGGTYTVPNSGVVGVFTAGGGPIFFEAGDTFAWSTTAPALTTSDIATAVTALLADTTSWEFLHIVGAPVDHTATATLFAALATHASTLESNKRYRSILMEASDSTDANLITAMASSSSTRVLVGTGYADLYIPTSKLILKRPSAWLMAARASCVPVHEDLARILSGPVQGVAPTSARPNGLYRNEETATTSLDDKTFSTLKQFINNDPAGVWITNAKMFVGASLTDFRYWQHRRVMDKACTLARSLFLELLSDDVRVETEGDRKGKILEQEAIHIEDSVTARLRAAMGENCSDIQAQVSRDDNLLSTETLTATVSIIPFGYLKTISATITFHNPATTPAVA
jgi:hypothetical protein